MHKEMSKGERSVGGRKATPIVCSPLPSPVGNDSPHSRGGKKKKDDVLYDMMCVSPEAQEIAKFEFPSRDSEDKEKQKNRKLRSILRWELEEAETEGKQKEVISTNGKVNFMFNDFVIYRSYINIT